MKISKHAKDRSKERNGWNEKTTERMVQKILEKGITHKQVRGRLEKWMSGIYERYKKKGKDVRLYGDKAYVFVGTELLTVLQIPANITKDMDKFIRKDSKDSENDSE